ncbi:MAG: thymidylate kinase [Gemmatimonadetes bacterium]|nr:thymidylate kinase [Gemmatimonadota bacterium]
MTRAQTLPSPASKLVEPHPYPGRLIIVEGIDGSGKSTQIALAQRWLHARGFRTFFTEWNSSLLVKSASRMGKKKDLLTPTTFSLLHATDFADRLYYKIVPALKAGMIVLADRYAYTAFGRDVARGVSPRWVRALYSFAVRPDVALYFRVPVDVSLERIRRGRAKIKYHEAGMDLRLSDDVYESFRLFQGRIIQEYDGMVDEFGLQVIDASREIDDQQQQVRDLLGAALRDTSYA